MADIFRRGQFASQKFLKIIPVMRHDFQQKIGLAHQHVALAHLWPGADHLLELLEIGLGLAGQADKGKDPVPENLNAGLPRAWVRVRVSIILYIYI